MHDPGPSCIDVSGLQLPSPITPLHDALFEHKQVRLFVKRDDLIHPHLQGNKWRKLKYNLIQARQQGFSSLLTFGGAWSNHIHATAAAGHYFNFKTIGIIRGEAHQPLNPCLQDARDWGMQLHYVNRRDYRNKTDPDFIDQLHRHFGEFYCIAEGGNNAAGIQGCTEIVGELERDYDVVCVDCGTGATMAGLIQALDDRSQVLGFAVLKNAGFLVKDITQALRQQSDKSYNNWHMQLDYHFGGYARTSPALFHFIDDFKQQHGIQLEPVYSGKMFYGLMDLIRQDYFKPGSVILAIHSGGLQGLRGFKT
jgi:1-aminocyclopropane-1-carboxylate deaminase/D-cysteine desulfhydrase-like pyridoxal-dependent ACC family enzyme